MPRKKPISDDELIAEAKRRNGLDLPHRRCMEAVVREVCSLCLAGYLAEQLDREIALHA